MPPSCSWYFTVYYTLCLMFGVRSTILLKTHSLPNQFGLVSAYFEHVMTFYMALSPSPIEFLIVPLYFLYSVTLLWYFVFLTSQSYHLFWIVCFLTHLLHSQNLQPIAPFWGGCSLFLPPSCLPAFLGWNELIDSWPFSSSLLHQIFFFVSSFQNFNCVAPCEFDFILFGFRVAPCICWFMSLGNFSLYFFKSFSPALLSFSSPPGTLRTWILDLLLLCHTSLRLCSSVFSLFSLFRLGEFYSPSSSLILPSIILICCWAPPVSFKKYVIVFFKTHWRGSTADE